MPMPTHGVVVPAVAIEIKAFVGREENAFHQFARLYLYAFGVKGIL